jgi:hypothetical protein
VLDGIVISRTEFEALLSELVTRWPRIDSVQIRVAQSEPFEPVIFGSRGTGESTFSDEVPLDSGGRFIARIAVWANGVIDTEAKREIRDDLATAVSRFWRGDERDEKGKILSTQYPTVQLALRATVATWSARSGVAFVFADLDQFKRFNDAHGPAEGDRLIAVMAAALSAGATAT